MAAKKSPRKPLLILTYDMYQHVFLEVEKYVENNRTKAKQTFNALADLALAVAKGSLRKRKGASLKGFYLPVFRFYQIEDEVRKLYRIQVSKVDTIPLEQDIIDEVADSWPNDATFVSRHRPFMEESDPEDGGNEP